MASFAEVVDSFERTRDSERRTAAANRHLLTAVQQMRDRAEEDLQLAIDALLRLASPATDEWLVRHGPGLAEDVLRQLARRKEPGSGK